MYHQVYNYLDKNDILYDSQYGFRNRRSCEQAITEFIGQILQAKEEGKSSASIFPDLSKAVDTLNHEVLLHKLDRYGVRVVQQLSDRLITKGKGNNRHKQDSLFRQIPNHMWNSTGVMLRTTPLHLVL